MSAVMPRRGLLACCAAAAATAVALPLAGCAAVPETPPQANLITLNQQAADALLQGGHLDPRQPLLVAAFVNLDMLTESSRLGRLFSEQVAGRLANRGYPVVELKLRDNLFFKQGQALLLSQEVREVSQVHQAQAVVVGTYTASPNTLYVSLKLVATPGSIILAAHDYAVPMDANVRGLLAR
ncbi:FlgO family outer membrane protein [Ramlibacter sp. H39-3-26]|uniref:FlgO family outer membrane protein n=1 Tax=Curvibacter soli TaxID=3031331 RepID=UPI0023DCB4F5|nr:FlgO family outer membrane protein [Ramlibacter sp. H39-3-26]MDF1486055.1 FlgO family outer membrane protein [Ramlibacter sp. H39-3-26]